MRIRVLTVSILAGSLALGACKRTEAPVPEPEVAAMSTASPAASEAPIDRAVDLGAADDNLNAVLWVQTSVEYDAIATQTYRTAAAQLDRALADPDWHALVPEERSASKSLPPAVVLDIDETVLDNSPYQARLVRNGLEYNEVTWATWVAEKKARALPGVVEFARAADAKGITLLYISNRAQHLDEATIANLRAVGLPVKDPSVFMGLGTVVEGCEQNGSEKNCRRQRAGREYRVLMQFGDQLGDFVEVLSNTAAGRADLLEEYGDWFGERWWMLPNPTYGSWEPAAFNNDWTQPREARRAAKRAALDVAP
ncbi:MAG: 5'-nucleotidase, lipoprotein e(P4) family [Proteobacteria bacterium]|nr:5'-nucleotidase, lipoprotein e(P4) family [Pseudomonadota bacterium]